MTCNELLITGKTIEDDLVLERLLKMTRKQLTKLKYTCKQNWRSDIFLYGTWWPPTYQFYRTVQILTGRGPAVLRIISHSDAHISCSFQSHSYHEAHWEGTCKLPPELQQAFMIRKFIDPSEETLTESMQDLSTTWSSILSYVYIQQLIHHKNLHVHV